MKKITKQALIYSLPFATWMALMFLMPATAESYAIRSVATLAIGIGCWIANRKISPSSIQPSVIHTGNICISSILGIIVGLAIFALWIWMPSWPYPEPIASESLPYAPQTCGWPLTIAKLIGSAFIIAPVEELFFRSFLYRRLIARDFTSVSLSTFDLSAFLWVVFLFTLEHDRPIAAAITGVAYGLLAIRFGLSSAIVAHITTNLVLALHVIFNNAWQFW